MKGPSVTPRLRTVLAACGQSSWCPGSASLPVVACFSYQAPISAIHASRSGPCICWPASVIAPSIRYFIVCLHVCDRHPIGTLLPVPRTARLCFRHRAGLTSYATITVASQVGISGAGGRVVQTGGHPIVRGAWLGAPGAPTVLVYG